MRFSIVFLENSEVAVVRSEVANLASELDCSNLCSFCDMPFLMDFLKNFRIRKFEVSQNLKTPTL